jgi:outer membrane protein assembly factor BamA/autotransporter translocation and assembly factor TamB
MNETTPAKRSTHARFGIVAGAVVAALGFAALHVPAVRGLALRAILSQLTRSGVVAHADRLDYNLARLRFHLSGVVLATPSTEAEPFLVARDVEVALGWQVIFGRLVLTDVAIDEPRVSFVSAAGGTANWPGASNAPAHSSFRRRVRIEHVRVTDLRVQWQDAQSTVEAGFSFELTSGNGDVSGRLVATRPARVAWRNHQTSVEFLDGRVSWNGSDLGIAGLGLRMPEGTLRADGRIEALADEPRLDAHVVADADVAAVTPWFDFGRATKGTSHVDCRVAGPLAQPDATVVVSGRDVAVAGVSPASFDAALRVHGRTAELGDFRAEVAGGVVRARGRFAFDGVGAIRAEWQKIDLASAVRDAVGRRVSVEPAAGVSGSLDARWTALRLQQLELTANAQVARDSARGNPPSGAANRPAMQTASLPLDGAAILELRALGWRLSTTGIGTDGVRITGSVSGSLNVRDLAQSSIDGSLHAQSDDAQSVVNGLVRSGLIRTAPTLRGAGSADFTVSGTVGRPSLEGPLRASIRYESLPDAMLRARTAVSQDGIRVEEIDARLGGATVRGDLGWSNGSDAVRGMFDASVALGDLTGLFAAFPKDAPVSGQIGLSAALSGTLARPQATIAGNSGELDVAGQRFDRSSFAIRADIGNSRFVLDQLELQCGGGRVDGRGSVDLADDTYTAHLTVTDVPIRPLTGVLPPDTPVSARLGASFDGEGSFRNLGGRGHVSLAAAHWRAADVGNIGADLTLAGRAASVSIDAPALALAGSGTAGVDPDGVLSFRGEWTPDDLAATARRLGVSIPAGAGGSAVVGFELNGTRDRLNELRAIFALNALTATAGGQTIRLSRPGAIEYDGRAARVEDVGLVSGGSTLTIGGALGSQAAQGLTLSLDGELADFAFVNDFVRSRASGAARLPSPSGSVQLRLTATGALAQPDLTGTLQIDDGRVPLTAAQSVTGIGMSARLDGGVLTIDSAAAAFEGATLTATARLPGAVVADRLPPSLRRRLAPTGSPAMLSAKVSSVTAAIASPFVDPQTLAQLGGHIDATIQLEADRLAPDRVRGTLTLDQSDLSLGGMPFNQQTPTRLAVQDGRLTVEAWEWGAGDNRIAVRGGARLGTDSSLDLVATSVLDLRALNVLAPAARILGRADAEVRVGGSLRSPTLDGWVTFSNGEARIASPRLVVGDVTGTVTLAADTMTFQRIFASVNGGDSEITGTIRHRWFTPLGGRITMATNGAALVIEGLQAETNANLSLETDPSRPAIAGTVTLVRGAFREQLSLTSGLLRGLQAPAEITVPAAPSALDRLRLDVRVVTQDDLIVDNNYARLGASADLRLVGTASRPSLTGRVTLAEGGSIYFGTRRYRLDKPGAIDFANPARIEPDLSVSAVTLVQGTEITLELNGTPATLQSTLRSDNPLYTQNDLISLLLVGRTASEASSAPLAQSGTALVGLFSDQFLGTTARALGLSTVRVESGTPDIRFDAGLVATETDPSTRLTVGKNIGSRLEVVFSQSLHQTDGLTWIVSYSPRSNITMRVVSLDTGDRLYDFRHDLTFGRPSGELRATPPAPEKISTIETPGAGADEKSVRSLLRLREGDRFSFFLWQDDRDRIDRYFHDRDRLEARVVTRRVLDPAGTRRVALIYDIRPGERTVLRIEGFTLPGSAIRDIKTAWTSVVVDDLLQEEAVRIARRAMADAGYVLAGVTTRVQRTAEEKQLFVVIDPGAHAGNRDVAFQGNRGLSTKSLLAVTSAPGLSTAVWVEPDRVRDALVATYRANGYLNATVHIDPISMAGGTATRPIRIEEGEAFRLRDIRTEGAKSLSPAEVIAKTGLSRGQVLTDVKMDQARAALDSAYRALGFNSVEVMLRSETAGGTPQLDLDIRVDEGRRQRLREVEISGLEHTSHALVSRTLKLNVGEPVNLAAWNAARRRLYETGAFRSVDIEREVIPERAEDAGSNAVSDEAVRALVAVQEWPRYRLRYGVELNDTAQSAGDAGSILPSFEQFGRTFSLGASGDVAARNLFGQAVTAGVAARYTLDFRAVRTYATMPTFLGRRITTTFFLEQSSEDSGATPTGPAFITDKTTVTFEQRVRPFAKTQVAYGYTAERNHTFDATPNPNFDVSVFIPKLTSNVTVDTRNDPIDAVSGWFHASAVEYSPEALGSELRFVRLFIQQRYYHKAGPIVLATWARLGLATAFDKSLLPTDRFFAGGGNSVRGYPEDALSPRDVLGDAVGGNGLIILNQEARFPLLPYVRGVAFLDAGRAFPTASQISLRNLSAGTGLGFRVVTPIILLRFDMGVPLDPAFAPRRPRWFFSVGQTF